MAILDAVLQQFPELSEDQRAAVGYTEGPLLIIAGPGSGKTLVLVVRALNILLQERAEPREILLCTFTEKAAFELRDRLSLSAKKLGYRGDLSELLTGTIHGICNDFLMRHRHHTSLGNNYEVLDELTQLFFLFDHFDEILGPEENGKYFGRWSTRWTAIEGARNYFNKITEELIDPTTLSASTDPFVQSIGRAYQAYKAKLFEANCIDFAHQQKLFFHLLGDPEGRITGFDRMRLHYVAFSRAEKILALTTGDRPKSYFNPIWQDLPQWPYVRQDLLKSLFFRVRQRTAVKKTFSFTGDLKVYETCPRQYRFFRHYEFTPARSAEILFGALVHQTIEEIHRRVLDGKADDLNEAQIRELFDLNFRHLVHRGIRPIGERQREEAFGQVMGYFHQNQEEMKRVIETEVDVSVEKDTYILTGKIDLLLGGDGKLELLDFKSQPRPAEDDARLDTYYKQLCVYGHILEQRYEKRPDRLLLYWTGEPRKEDALMVFPYRMELIEEAGAHFDRVVAQILARDFGVKRPPESRVCKECDFRVYCSREGTVKVKEEDL